MDEKSFTRWVASPLDLQNMTPEKARDLVVTCFYEAQRETFHRARERAGLAGPDENLSETVRGMIRMVFKEVGGSFDAPDAEIIQKVVEACARKAAIWGTPPDIIEHHKQQIGKILSRL